MDADKIIDLSMDALSKKVTAEVDYFDENKTKRATKKADSKKLNTLAKRIRGTLIYAD